jgi:hypothetical protein
MTGHRLVTDAAERVGLPPAKLAVTPGAGARTLADICGRRIAYAEGTAQQVIVPASLPGPHAAVAVSSTRCRPPTRPSARAGRSRRASAGRVNGPPGPCPRPVERPGTVARQFTVWASSQVMINTSVRSSAGERRNQRSGGVAQSAECTSVPSLVAASIIASIALAGTITRPRILTAGNSPAAIARYTVIGDSPNIAATSATL